MLTKETSAPDLFRPATPQELVARALARIDDDGMVRCKTEDGRILVSSLLPAVDLEQLPNDVWLRTLLTVAWTLFRQYRHHSAFDEETLGILAMYLGAYRHDRHFLDTASALIHCNEQSSTWESPRLPKSHTRQVLVPMMRKR